MDIVCFAEFSCATHFLPTKDRYGEQCVQTSALSDISALTESAELKEREHKPHIYFSGESADESVAIFILSPYMYAIYQWKSWTQVK